MNVCFYGHFSKEQVCNYVIRSVREMLRLFEQVFVERSHGMFVFLFIGVVMITSLPYMRWSFMYILTKFKIDFRF